MTDVWAGMSDVSVNTPVFPESAQHLSGTSAKLHIEAKQHV